MKQVKDDPELLDLMLENTKHAPDLYKPTNYWINYEKIFLPELSTLGLRDFRRRKNSVLSSFGATDLVPSSKCLHSLPIWKRNILTKFLREILQLSLKVRPIEKLFTSISKCVSGVGLQDVRLLCYEFVKCYGEKNGAKSISEFEASTIGNPEDVFSINEKTYTTSILYYYIQYAYCCQFMNFESIDSMMEIGSGSGKQIEVIKKLHPDICFYVFDIPPQLYVCEQYLSALFPNSVVSYRQTRTMKSIPKQHAGKIFLFSNWKLPELRNLNYDLFWNSASFQEMEPEVVLNYLNYVNSQTNHYIFLHEMMEGQKLATTKDEHGVLKQTTLKHYKRGLKDFKLQDLSRSIFLPKIYSPYNFSFWSKKTK